MRPTSDEIATLMVGGEDVEEIGGDIIVCKLDGNLERIYSTHPSYMVLQYPLLILNGTDSWGREIPLAKGSTSSSHGVTIYQYYAFRIQFRLNEANIYFVGVDWFFNLLLIVLLL